MRLIKGDCLEEMQKLIDEGIKVDLILTDPPYGTTDCKWDNIIPFESMWDKINKLIKDNGAIALFSVMPFTALLVTSNLKCYKHHWIWEKNRGTGFQVAKYRPMMKHEDIIVFSNRGKRVNYYPQKIKLDTPKKYNKASSSNGVNPLSNFNKGSYIIESKFPVNIIKANKVAKPMHPTQKPVELLEYLIKTYTNEGDLVLDFTMGSGSTGVACKNLNRRFIGIELDDKYFEIAKERIDNN